MKNWDISKIESLAYLSIRHNIFFASILVWFYFSSFEAGIADANSSFKWRKHVSIHEKSGNLQNWIIGLPKHPSQHISCISVTFLFSFKTIFSVPAAQGLTWVIISDDKRALWNANKETSQCAFEVPPHDVIATWHGLPATSSRAIWRANSQLVS